MARLGFSYARLAEILEGAGIDENERNLRNKINRGTFSATFMIQCFVAMGSPIIRLGEPGEIDIRTFASKRS